jgi:hypothetical protein
MSVAVDTSTSKSTQNLFSICAFLFLGLFTIASAWLPVAPEYSACHFRLLHATSLKLSSADGLSQPTPRGLRESVWELLQRNFQGDFDNYNQVLKDREKGLLPREGGGHENFHCTLIPVSEDSRLAAFYFDGNPRRIFRFRYYQFLPIPASSEDDCVEMRLYTLKPDLEELLREHSENPIEWPKLFSGYDEGGSLEDKINYLPNCEITWSREKDPVQHSYVPARRDSEACVHAVMVHGEAIVDSTVIPGLKIRILDQLSLFHDIFYINDRGLDPETGSFIYGNQRGVPYRLERVATLCEGERRIVNNDLAWTLGSSWRSADDYDARIAAAGGGSVQIRAFPKPDSN